MSETEKTLFLQETRRILLRIFIPVATVCVIAIGSFAIAAPFRIKATEAKVEAIDARTDAFVMNYVSNEMMIRYMNELHALGEALYEHEKINHEDIARINARIDEMFKSWPRSVTRGANVQ